MLNSRIASLGGIFFGAILVSPLASLVWAGLEASDSGLTWSAFRVRSDAAVELNASEGWAAGENQPAQLSYDQPFRLRIEVANTSGVASTEELRLQYRMKGGSWMPVGLSSFPYPLYATPPLSLISDAVYAFGEESEDLLLGSRLEHEDGIGLKGVQATPLFRLAEGSMEWEWSLVARRFSDGPFYLEDGEAIELRVVDGDGHALGGRESVGLTFSAAEGHLGGTFVETPSRIGPYQSSKGTLYFIMEPTETDNRFMMVASRDGGLSWKEVDGSGRPSVGDLEGVGSVFHEGILHIIHQTSDAVFYHAFATEDSERYAEKWVVDSEVIAEPSEPPTQAASLSVRADGSLLAVYGSATGGFLHKRTPEGVWADEGISLESPGITGLSGFQVETAADGRSSLVAYTAGDGTGWLRWLQADGELSEPMLVSDTLGVEDEENGALLPILVPESGGALLIYRKADRSLWERRYMESQGLSVPRLVTQGPVVTQAVDSDQAGADAVLHGDSVYVLYIDEATRSIYSTSSRLGGDWTPSRKLIGGIDAAWVRGSALKTNTGKAVYGFVYDAGSQGGAGMNRYAEIPLE
ncbi:MAG: exo-alpha-sialidase [Verrucomicrobiota bacterium]